MEEEFVKYITKLLADGDDNFYLLEQTVHFLKTVTQSPL